jgi:NAD(P)-dependent dehydrogenase (short-subunit alcohol dehydrogenase family)
MSKRLEAKVAIITGGAGYIGTAITQSFCREGARVVIADFDETKWQETCAKLAPSALDQVAFIKTDARDDAQIRAMAHQVAATYGRIDILIAMVGGSKDALIHKMTDEQWDQVIDLNLRSMFLACRAVVPFMIERQAGKIVLMSSRSYLGNIGQVNYATAKAGVIGFVNSLSREMARYRVNVNAVVPGFIDNPRLANMPEKYRQMRIELNPFQTAAEPKDVAEVILFLSSDEARQVTGQSIRVACW